MKKTKQNKRSKVRTNVGKKKKTRVYLINWYMLSLIFNSLHSLGIAYFAHFLLPISILLY